MTKREKPKKNREKAAREPEKPPQTDMVTRALRALAFFFICIGIYYFVKSLFTAVPAT